jgi:hypothetical protein
VHELHSACIRLDSALKKIFIKKSYFNIHLSYLIIKICSNLWSGLKWHSPTSPPLATPMDHGDRHGSPGLHRPAHWRAMPLSDLDFSSGLRL